MDVHAPLQNSPSLLFNLDIHRVIVFTFLHVIYLQLYHTLISEVEWFQKHSKQLNLNHSKVSLRACFVNAQLSGYMYLLIVCLLFTSELLALQLL